MINPDAQAFYKESLQAAIDSGVSFLVGGGLAIAHYTGISRDTKDLDLFVRSTDYPKLMKFYAEQGFETEMTDVRWLAKIRREDYYVDLIFSSVHNICAVDDSWFERAPKGQFYELEAPVVPIEEMIWCKSYVWNRERFDGADINHLILKQAEHIDWKWLLGRLDQHWHLLLAELILFQFVYPSEYREIIPKWLMDELTLRLQDQWILPPAVERVCRGPMIDSTQYHTDVRDWLYLSYTIKTV